MSQYYLMSQLPSLDALSESSPLPITEDSFNELCGRFLSKKAVDVLNTLTLVPSITPENTGYMVVDEWNKGERQLRLALAGVRAGRLKKNFDAKEDSLEIRAVQIAKAAVDIGDPMEAESFLCKHRLDYLESLRPYDAFCDNAVFYYALKLKLLQRMRLFDENTGRKAYLNLYDSILYGEKKEAEQ